MVLYTCTLLLSVNSGSHGSVLLTIRAETNRHSIRLIVPEFHGYLESDIEFPSPPEGSTEPTGPRVFDPMPGMCVHRCVCESFTTVEDHRLWRESNSFCQSSRRSLYTRSKGLLPALPRQMKLERSVYRFLPTLPARPFNGIGEIA